MPSKPEYFNLAPHSPLELEQAIIPVREDFVTTTYLPPVGTDAPVTGPVIIINLFSLDKESTLGSISSKRILLPNPLAPINFLAISKFKGSTFISSVVQLILNNFFS